MGWVHCAKIHVVHVAPKGQMGPLIQSVHDGGCCRQEGVSSGEDVINGLNTFQQEVAQKGASEFPVD